MNDKKLIIAIAGATTPKGKALKEALPASLFRLSTVRLLDEEDLDGTLTEYDGGVELIKKITLDALQNVDLVFLCDPYEKSLDIAKLIRENLTEDPPTIINLGGDYPEQDASLLMNSMLPRAAVPTQTVFIPDPLATGLAIILDICKALEKIDFASASALLPVSEIGTQGITALQDQVVELMNFGKVPQDIFGGQLIFNIQAGSEKTRGMTEYEERVAGQTRRLLNDPKLALAVVCARVPVFFSIMVSLTVNFTADLELSSLLTAFEQSDRTRLAAKSGGELKDSGSLESTGSNEFLIHRILGIPGNSSTIQVWFSYDNITTGSVNHAIKIAENIFRNTYEAEKD